MKRTNLLLIFTLLFALLSGCTNKPQPVVSSTATQPPATPSPTAPAPVYWPGQDWRLVSPEQQGMDSGKLAEMLEAVQSRKLNIHSVLVIRGGTLVLEAYADPYGPKDRHVVESNTKSVIGALIGIAIEQGLIQSADQKLVSFFPVRVIKNLDERKKAITLHDLLSMTPGLDCADSSPAGQGMYPAGAWLQYLLDLPMTADPGKQWIYCSGASHLLSAVIEQVSGMSARAYANQVLFGPLGIAPVDEKDWGGDPQGISNGVAGLYLTPRELAKFGLLYLNQGRWDGRQVVPSAWVEKSTTEQAYIGKDAYVGGLDRRFGYMFSTFPDLNYYGYLGMAGQELFVLPEQNMVVVFTAGLEVGKEAALLELVNQYILPAVKSTAPIAENPGGQSRLLAAVQALEDPRQPVPALPQAAQGISGKKYLFEQNPFGWTEITLWFEPGADEALAAINGVSKLKIGLDNRFRLNEIPNTRPLALRGRWESAGTFVFEDINLGEFQLMTGEMKFTASQVTITARDHNFGSPPVIMEGKQASE